METLMRELRLRDCWRELHPDDRRYTFFQIYKAKIKEQYWGWRLDYFLVDRHLMRHVQDCHIRDEIYNGSDHVPVVLTLSDRLL